MKSQETKDAELVALASLVFSQAVGRLGANQFRERRGAAPAYTDEPTQAENALAAELKWRGVISQ